jgi:hypothetical protein
MVSLDLTWGESMKKLLPAALLAVSFAGQAEATSCAQSDAIGQWNLLGTVLATKTQGYWVSCIIKIAAAGKISDAFCQDGFGRESEATGRISQKAAGVCQFTGTLKYKTGGIASQVNTSFMSQDKKTVTGAGFSDGAMFTFTMMKL